MANLVLAQAAKLVQAGKITEAIEALEGQMAAEPNNYSLTSNLAALNLQLGLYENAIHILTQAIALDPYAHIAYFNRFLAHFAQQEKQKAWRDLQKALSCLYLVRGSEQQNLKFLNKSIQYCQQNARAYLVRAALNQGKNNKLVQNDYSAAIEYDPNLVEVYQQRALFFRKCGRTRQFQQDLAIIQHIRGSPVEPITHLADNEEESLGDGDHLNLKIQQKVKEFQELLKRKSIHKEAPPQTEQEEVFSKLPLSSIQSRIDKKEDDEMLLSDRQEEDGTARTINIKKEQIQFKKRPEDLKFDKKFNEIFQEENSQELNEEIERLENEIKEEGGKISLEKADEELDISDPSNFLTEEIEKAIKEIESYGAKDLNEVKSVKSAKSINSQGSIGSKLSENKQLSIGEFAKYDNIKIEIVSLQDIQNYLKKETAKIVLKYGSKTCETSMGKFEWREEFKIPLNKQLTEVQVTAIQKGGIFRDNFQIGQGSINLLETSIAKCILGTKQKKTAILYFKMSLV